MSRWDPTKVNLCKATCEGCGGVIHNSERIQRLGPFRYRHARCAKRTKR